jgi:hypothetical protein
MTDILQTSVGPAVVRHRLALAVECRDALSDLPVHSPVEVSYRRPPKDDKLNPPWRPLSRIGNARFILRHRIPDDPKKPLPQLVQIRIRDRSRYYVPRRFTVTPWTYAEVQEPAPYVAAYARLLRLWLQPGSAYPFPRTATVIRGRVVHADTSPVRWARVEGMTPFGPAGWAHGDERGEFILPILNPGFDPVNNPQLNFAVTLDVSAAKNPIKPDPNDRTADLISEVIARSSNPPLSTELDNSTLRGEVVPSGYVGNLQPAPQVTVSVGAELKLTTVVIFKPQP